MCEKCEKLEVELKELRRKWNSPELTYSRSIELTYKKFGGGTSINFTPSGTFINTYLKNDYDKILSHYQRVGLVPC